LILDQSGHWLYGAVGTHIGKKREKKNLWVVGRERGGGPGEEESGWEQATEGYKSRAERAIRFRRTMINHGKKEEEEEKKISLLPVFSFFPLHLLVHHLSALPNFPKGEKPLGSKRKKGNHQEDASKVVHHRRIQTDLPSEFSIPPSRLLF
jgi:hypothetical protein